MDPTDPRLSQTFLLHDGRQLGFADWGEEDGDLAVFDFHGGPGCRLPPSGDEKAIAASGLRWITVDRPALGLSWPCPGRTVASWPNDVAELADHLGIDRFAVLGWSMGGPNAAACAALLGNRVLSLTLLAPAPLTLPEATGAEGTGKSFAWILARDEPWKMAELYTALGLEARRNPQTAVALFSGGLSPTESLLIGRDDVAASFVAMMVEATRQGSIGLVDDMRVQLAPWGFDPSTITVPTTLWQGDEDSFVGMPDAEFWAATIPAAEFHRLQGHGHLFPYVLTDQIIGSINRGRAVGVENS